VFDWDLMGYNLYNVLGFESFTIRFHQNVQLGIGNQKKYIFYMDTRLNSKMNRQFHATRYIRYLFQGGQSKHAVLIKSS
jgi:hypothetical protein